MSIAVLVLVILGSEAISNTAYASEVPPEGQTSSSSPESLLPSEPPVADAPEAPAQPAAPETPLTREDCNAVRGTDYLSDEERGWYLTICIQANRASCSTIRGTDYLSDAERTWFADNCVTRASREQITTAAQPAAIQQRFVEAPAAPVQSIAAAEAPVVESVIDRFSAGYRDAGGPEAYLSRIINRVIPCESSGNPRAYSRVGPFYGLMQFLPATWRATGGGDWFDPWQQGANTARLLQRANPATQWPVCWHR